MASFKDLKDHIRFGNMIDCLKTTDDFTMCMDEIVERKPEGKWAVELIRQAVKVGKKNPDILYCVINHSSLPFRAEMLVYLRHQTEPDLRKDLLNAIMDGGTTMPKVSLEPTFIDFGARKMQEMEMPDDLYEFLIKEKIIDINKPIMRTQVKQVNGKAIKHEAPVDPFLVVTSDTKRNIMLDNNVDPTHLYEYMDDMGLVGYDSFVEKIKKGEVTTALAEKIQAKYKYAFEEISHEMQGMEL